MERTTSRILHFRVHSIVTTHSDIVRVPCARGIDTCAILVGWSIWSSGSLWRYPYTVHTTVTRASHGKRSLNEPHSARFSQS